MQKSKFSYPYDYGDELTPQMAESNRKILLTILLLIWRILQVEAAPLPGTKGFPIKSNINTLRGRKNPSQCKNYGIISRSRIT